MNKVELKNVKFQISSFPVFRSNCPIQTKEHQCIAEVVINPSEDKIILLKKYDMV